MVERLARVGCTENCSFVIILSSCGLCTSPVDDLVCWGNNITLGQQSLLTRIVCLILHVHVHLYLEIHSILVGVLVLKSILEGSRLLISLVRHHTSSHAPIWLPIEVTQVPITLLGLHRSQK